MSFFSVVFYACFFCFFCVVRCNYMYLLTYLLTHDPNVFYQIPALIIFLWLRETWLCSVLCGVAGCGFVLAPFAGRTPSWNITSLSCTRTMPSWNIPRSLPWRKALCALIERTILPELHTPIRRKAPLWLHALISGLHLPSNGLDLPNTQKPRYLLTHPLHSQSTTIPKHAHEHP